MQRLLTINNREYRVFDETRLPGTNLCIGFRDDHDFERGPASLLLIPVQHDAFVRPWQTDAAGDDAGDAFDCQAGEHVVERQAAGSGPHVPAMNPPAAVSPAADSSEDYTPGA